MPIENRYHEGELLVQQKVGETVAAEQNSRVIAKTILKGALKFIEQQPMVVLGSVDRQDNVWASVLFGHPGFMKAVDQQTVELDLTQVAGNRHDPFFTNIKHRPQIGMLVIELVTRRRLRINGQIASISPEKLRLDVMESYPNCPRYIQRRHLTYRQGSSSRSVSVREGYELTLEQQASIASADTFFVASAHPIRGVDASHRGGSPNFVRVLNDRTIRIPDYAGNSMFNTLGNFAIDPHAGLIFVDFEGDRTLQLIGRPEILWELNDPTHETGGTKRYWTLDIKQWLEMDLPRSLNWEFLDYSPYNPS